MISVSIILAVEISPRQYVICVLLLFGGCLSPDELCVLFYRVTYSIVAGNIWADLCIHQIAMPVGVFTSSCSSE